MVALSHLLGISYQQLNVLLFVVLHPALTVFLFWKYRKYKKLWEEQQNKEGK
jgi:hypothetical protein